MAAPHALPTEKKAVSVWFELLALIDALEWSRMLLDQATRDGPDADEETRRLPVLAMAIEKMVVVRLRDLCRVIRHELDPGRFWTPFNNALPAEVLGDDHDVLFQEWSPATSAPTRLPRRPRKRSKRG